MNHVHEELSAIAASLREKQRSLAAREAELNKREANVTRDEEFIQKLQEKEAVTVGLLEKEVHRGAEVDAENKAHIEQLESTCDQLRARCAALAKQQKKQNHEQQQQALKLQQQRHQLEKELQASAVEKPSVNSNATEKRVRELEQQLDRSRSLPAALLLDDTDNDWRHALPGAAEALFAEHSAFTAAARRKLLSLIYTHCNGKAPSAAESPQWERRVASNLAKAASTDAAPLFGKSAADAPLAAMLLLRLGLRAHQRGGGGKSAAGLGEMSEGLACVRKLCAVSATAGFDCRARLLSLGAVDEAVAVLSLATSSAHARPQLAKGAAAVLISLCATADGKGMTALATPSFVSASLATLTAEGATDDDPEPIGACVSLLLQRLSAGPARWRSLIKQDGVKSVLTQLQQLPKPPAFIVANLKSVLSNLSMEVVVREPAMPLEEEDEEEMEEEEEVMEAPRSSTKKSATPLSSDSSKLTLERLAEEVLSPEKLAAELPIALAEAEAVLKEAARAMEVKMEEEDAEARAKAQVAELMKELSLEEVEEELVDEAEVEAEMVMAEEEEEAILIREAELMREEKMAFEETAAKLEAELASTNKAVVSPHKEDVDSDEEEMPRRSSPTKVAQLPKSTPPLRKLEESDTQWRLGQTPTRG